MRKEIKFEFPLGYNISLERYLLINSCKEIYKPRKVNSFYYDDYNFSLFNQNIDGIGFRNKYRCRFYNDGKDGFIVENKLKRNQFNEKKFLDPKKINKTSLIRNQKDLTFKVSETEIISLPPVIMENYYPKVFVSYKRKYFMSYYRKARITIDTKINFSKVLVKKNNIFLLAKRFLNHNILEIKFENDSLEISNFISNIANEFNLTYSKCSKYTKAIELIY